MVVLSQQEVARLLMQFSDRQPLYQTNSQSELTLLYERMRAARFFETRSASGIWLSIRSAQPFVQERF